MTIAVLGGIVGTFALLATANVMLGAVTERTREIGLLRAVGMQPRTVWSLFLLEGCLLGLVGGLCGAALSFLVGQWVINSAGLSFPPPPGGASAVPVRIDFALGLVTWSVLLIVLVATASGGVAA